MAPSVYRDLTGCVFGRWTVISRAPNTPAQQSQWNCICACGASGVVLGGMLRQGRSRSCGCLRDETTGERLLIDLTNRRFGRLHVVKRAPNSVRGKVRWECLCDCGATVIASSWVLTSGHQRSCGCLKADLTHARQFEDLTGQRFGRLIVVEQDTWRPKGRRTAWHCVCDCGNRSTVQSIALKQGLIRSCGCLKNELAAERLTVHGHNRKRARSKEYACWSNMLSRCYNENNHGFANYGGKGITVCAEWRTSFEAFLADMGPCPSPTHSLDRIDPNGSYTKDNCRWATPQQQANNTRVNRWITFEGRTQTLTQWARELGITPGALHQRLGDFGWTLERALTRPPRKMKLRNK